MLDILIVEDSEERIAWFLQHFKKCNITVCKNARDAIRCVHLYTYSLIMLDHDLGDTQMMDSQEENTGYQVAKALMQSMNSSVPVLIHSYNPVGAMNMKAIIPHAAVAPFGTFDEDVLFSLCGQQSSD